MHRVWRGNGFWQAALMEGVAAQMDLMDAGKPRRAIPNEDIATDIHYR